MNKITHVWIAQTCQRASMLIGLGLPHVAFALDNPPANVLPTVHVIASPASVAAFDPESLSHQISIDTPEQGAERLESILEAEGLAQPSTLHSGLASQVQIRGFLSSKLYLDGMPDIQRMYSRDLVTVDQVNIQSGSNRQSMDAAAGYINQVSVKPSRHATQQVGISIDDQQLTRLHLDWGHALNADHTWQYRLTGAWQHGDAKLGNQPQDRHQVLLGLNWDYAEHANMLWQVEQQRNQRPFAFGTVYANNAIQFDRLYADFDAAPEGHASSHRDSTRYAWHWQVRHPQWEAKVQAAHARVQREEALFGFWNIAANNTQLNGYYTEYSDDYRQTDFSASIQASQLLQHRHTLHGQLSVLQHQQAIDFEGWQNIAGFRIEVDQPDFAQVQPDQLRRSSRFVDEDYVERTATASLQLAQVDRYQLSADLRYSEYHIDTRRDVQQSQRRVAQQQDYTPSVRATFTLNPKTTLYAHYAEAIEANRGMYESGDYLPPRQTQQHELGVVWNDQQQHLQLSAFQLTREGLVKPNPLNREYWIDDGQQRSKGIALAYRWQNPDWQLDSRMQWLSSQDQLGRAFQNVASRLWSGRVQRQIALDATTLSLGSQLYAVNERPLRGLPNDRMAGYLRQDLNIRWHNPQDWVVYLSVHNLWDTRYLASGASPSDLQQGARRRLTIGMTRSF